LCLTAYTIAANLVKVTKIIRDAICTTFLDVWIVTCCIAAAVVLGAIPHALAILTHIAPSTLRIVVFALTVYTIAVAVTCAMRIRATLGPILQYPRAVLTFIAVGIAWRLTFTASYGWYAEPE